MYVQPLPVLGHTFLMTQPALLAGPLVSTLRLPLLSLPIAPVLQAGLPRDELGVVLPYSGFISALARAILPRTLLLPELTGVQVEISPAPMAGERNHLLGLLPSRSVLTVPRTVLCPAVLLPGLLPLKLLAAVTAHMRLALGLRHMESPLLGIGFPHAVPRAVARLLFTVGRDVEFLLASDARNLPHHNPRVTGGTARV